MTTVYFSHPISTYHTEEEESILEVLKENFGTVLNPRDFQLKGNPMTCSECMEKGIKRHFFPMIEKSDNFVIWFPDYTCGIECELHYAAQIGKPLFMVENNPGDIEFEPITLQEYNFMRRYEE